MPSKEEQIFQKYFPAASVPYCLELWDRYKVQFRISPPRSSIYGNYRFRNGIHEISVNGNLGQQAFLVTFLHEMAHLLVRVSHGSRVLPHGKEWKHHFRQVMIPVLNTEIFQEPTLSALQAHLENPAATSCSDPVLHSILGFENQRRGSEDENAKEVGQMGSGDIFIYRGNRYIWLRKILKRIECQQVESGRIYGFRPDVWVLPAEQHPEEQVRSSLLQLKDLVIGQRFSLDGRHFELLEMKRKNAVCRDLGNGRDYLVSGQAPIKLIA